MCAKHFDERFIKALIRKLGFIYKIYDNLNQDNILTLNNIIKMEIVR